MDYFEGLKKELESCYSVVSAAREKGFDPEKKIEIKITSDLASRVDGIVGPPGIEKVIREMEKEGTKREDIAFKIVEKIAKGEIIQGSVKERIEQAVRTGVAIITEGVLVAPTEGIAKLEVKENPDGSNYVAVYYSGPIRSAGGTAAALSVVLADVARRAVGIGDYRPTDTEIERYVEEVNLYEARVTHLQYKPKDSDIRIIIRNCPICINGEPTEEIEVSVYKNLERVETNRIRGGIPLVVCEGIALKAAKVLRYTKMHDVDWNWLEKIIKIKVKEDKIEIKPDDSYLGGLVAGRPVFSYPSEKGGFRLRYGKTRTNGIMAKSIHPSVMILLDDFLAYGTQMKIERPGKGCVVSTCRNIEPPVVRLKNGEVVKVPDLDTAEKTNPEVEKILFLGDIVVTLGDFVKSNHPLLLPGYCEEWWEREVEDKRLEVPKINNTKEAFEFSRKQGVPLHPKYTFFWDFIEKEQLEKLVYWIEKAELNYEEEKLIELRLPISEEKGILEDLLIEHKVQGDKIVLTGENGYSLLSSLGMLNGKRVDGSKIREIIKEEENVLQILEKASGIKIRAKGGTQIGTRMGRPEKAKERAMDGKPNVLFPTGSPKNRSLTKIYKEAKKLEKGKMINLELARFRCNNCSNISIYSKCELCGSETSIQRICSKCNAVVEGEKHCERKIKNYERRPVNIIKIMENARKVSGESSPEEVKGVKGLSNKERIPERLEKGVLRARHGVYVFRDGTSRFDATDLPITHFKPNEIGVSLEKMKELGYSKDYLGKKLTNEEQLVPLKVQDIILSENGADYFIRVSKFIDDLLVNLYGIPAYYKIEKKEDLIGQLFVGLSPHTSAGVLCRVVGFTKANVGYAHPYFHTAKRRNCFDGNTRIPIIENNEWKMIRIKELVESNLKGKTKRDDFGTEYKHVDGIKTLSFNRKTKKFEIREIEAVSKHRNSKKMIELKTKRGRKINVTTDHPFPEKSERKIATEINQFLVPYKIDVPTKDISKLDLLKYSKDISVNSKKDLFAGYNLKKLSKRYGINYKTITNYRYRRSYPHDLLKKIGIKINKDALLSAKRDIVKIKRTIDVDEDLLFLLGFYLAEGHSRKKNKGHYQVSFAVCKKELKKKIIKKIKKVFGVSPKVSRDNMSICSRILYELFEGIGIGINAKTKKVPSFIYSLPKKKIVAFLKGYFYGDGSVSLASTLEVNATSINKDLLEEIGFLLTQFGIVYSFREEKREIKSKIIIDFYKKPKELHSYKLRIYSENARRFIESVGFEYEKQGKATKLVKKWNKNNRRSREEKYGECFIDKIINKRYNNRKENHSYSLTVGPHHTVVTNGVVSFQCDADEDSVILLMDALMNFSRHYLTERRGGTMDTPIVLNTKINPKEVDDEVFCMEIVDNYPLEFYKACEENAPPHRVKVKKVEDVLGKEEQYEHLPFTLDSDFIDQGNIRTAYINLQSIPEKIKQEFEIEEKIKCVDEQDVARRLILSHFIPDLYGNLRSYSRQNFRCVNCNLIYRRVPLIGKCRRCGGKLTLTIHKGGIEKYLEISNELANKYDLPLYLKQRLELIEREIRNIFEDEKIKQTGLSDFI